MSWEQERFEPIVLSDGLTLRTLRDAGHFIQDLPTAMQERPEWQTAAQALLDYAIANGWLWLHESGTYVKLTDAGAALFA